jgi:hypothetical protein
MSIVQTKLAIYCLFNVPLVLKRTILVVPKLVLMSFNFQKSNKNAFEKERKIVTKSLKKGGLKTLPL